MLQQNRRYGRIRSECVIVSLFLCFFFLVLLFYFLFAPIAFSISISSMLWWCVYVTRFEYTAKSTIQFLYIGAIQQPLMKWAWSRGEEIVFQLIAWLSQFFHPIGLWMCLFVCLYVCVILFFFHSRCRCFSFSNLVANSFRDGSTNMWEISIQCMCDDN